MGSLRFQDNSSAARNTTIYLGLAVDNQSSGALAQWHAAGGNRKALVFVCCKGNNSVSSITSDNGDTFTQLTYGTTGSAVGDARAEVWECTLNAGDTNITVYMSGAGYFTVSFVQFAGRMGDGRGDWYANLNVYTGTTSNANIQRSFTGLSADNKVLRFFGKEDSTGGFSTQAGMTLLGTLQTSSGTAANNVESTLVYKGSSAGTVTTDVLHTSTGDNYVDIAIEIVNDPELVTVSLPAAKDARIDSANTGTNYGAAGVNLGIGESNAAVSTYRTLIKVDLSSIPAGALVTGGTLYLTCISEQSDNNRQLVINRLLRDWGETTCTWNTYDGTNNWGTAGATGAADIDSVDLTSSEQVQPAAGDIVTMAINPDILAAMIGGAYANYGWLLRVDTESSDRAQYGDRGNSTVSNRPEFVVDYYPVQDQANFVLVRRNRAPGWVVAEKLALS
jgi:hypothetical protein